MQFLLNENSVQKSSSYFAKGDKLPLNNTK